MKNKTTLILAVFVGIIFVVIGVGYTVSRPQSTPAQQPVSKETPPPTAAELSELLATEKPVIQSILTSAYPTITSLYDIDREALYHRGEWYGAVLRYKGSDSENRDTLRVIMQKKDNTWKIRTTPPSILVSSLDIPGAPKSMIDDINRPATLPGTDTSPAITVGE